jgi:hypothetical protein
MYSIKADSLLNTMDELKILIHLEDYEMIVMTELLPKNRIGMKLPNK